MKRVGIVCLAIVLLIILGAGAIFFRGWIAAKTNAGNLKGLMNDFVGAISEYEEDVKIIETKSTYGKLVGNGNGIEYFGAVLVERDSVPNIDAILQDLNLQFESVEVLDQENQIIRSKYLEHRSLKYETEIPDGARYIRYVPAPTGEYLFHSTSTSGDPKVWLYDSGLTLVGTNDNSAGNSNFRLTATLTAGHTYYIVGGQSGQKTGSYVLHLLKTATVSDAIYYIKNVGTSKYIDIVGPVAQEWVHQWTAHTGLQEKWTFQRQTDGYYTIQSQYGNRYYIGISSTATGENNIKLYSGISDNTKWKIFELSSGQLILEPKTAVGKLLYAPNSNTGTVLQLSAMGLTTAIRNKWRIAYVSAFLGYHVPSKSFELMCTANTASNSTWYPLIVDSVNAWNDSMADANISLTAESSSYSIEVDSYTDSWFGLTCPITISENSLTNAEIFINSRTVSTDSNMRRSTITHEIGHLLGLKDNPPVSDNDSLMMHSRDRTLVFVPQKFDIENVDFIYN